MAAEKHRDARAGRVIGTARSSLDRDEIFLDLLPSAIAGFFESIVCIYIYIHVFAKVDVRWIMAITVK